MSPYATARATTYRLPFFPTRHDRAGDIAASLRNALFVQYGQIFRTVRTMYDPHATVTDTASPDRPSRRPVPPRTRMADRGDGQGAGGGAHHPAPRLVRPGPFARSRTTSAKTCRGGVRRSPGRACTNEGWKVATGAGGAVGARGGRGRGVATSSARGAASLRSSRPIRGSLWPPEGFRSPTVSLRCGFGRCVVPGRDGCGGRSGVVPAYGHRGPLLRTRHEIAAIVSG